MFHLTHYELKSAIVDLMQSWSTGSPPRGPAHWPAIAERRAAIGDWAKNDTPPALGPVPDIIDDPAIVMLWGITRESLDAWLTAGSEADSKELKGFAASRGVVEGIARVVKSVDEISRLRRGDILVCQVTNPTWSPIFRKIAAAVSDIGGSMSHAAIVAREYGLPAVVGTGTATPRIKDGQRIRVDGGRGVVTILGADVMPMTLIGADNDAMRQRMIGWFADITLADRPTVGGKGGSLGELSAPALPCRRDSWCEWAFGASPGAGTNAPVRAQVEAARGRSGEHYRVLAADAPSVEAASLPADVAEALGTPFRALPGPGAAVAVRSSATTEDAADASFAGLQDTFCGS